jgi:hypothetical protein
MDLLTDTPNKCKDCKRRAAILSDPASKMTDPRIIDILLNRYKPNMRIWGLILLVEFQDKTQYQTIDKQKASGLFDMALFSTRETANIPSGALNVIENALEKTTEMRAVAMALGNSATMSLHNAVSAAYLRHRFAGLQMRAFLVVKASAHLDHDEEGHGLNPRSYVLVKADQIMPAASPPITRVMLSYDEQVQLRESRKRHVRASASALGIDDTDEDEDEDGRVREHHSHCCPAKLLANVSNVCRRGSSPTTRMT